MKPIDRKLAFAAVALAAALLVPTPAPAHCDALDGPVVKAAEKALTEGKVNLVLIWVQKDDEVEVKQAFEKTLAVRQLGPQAKELADRYFYETLVRLHRAGEGAPFSGLKPAGRDLGPAIPAGDRALESGNLAPVEKLLSEKMEHGLKAKFQEVQARKTFDQGDVEGGRAYVKAYVEYIHYVEGLHEAASTKAHGHFPEGDEKAAHQHPE